MRPFPFTGLLAVVLGAGLCLPPLPATAQQTLKFSPKATVDCLKRAKTSALRAACIGESAKVCFNRFKPKTNGDVAACMAAETGYWTKRMDAAYDKLALKAAEEDAQFPQAQFSLVEDLQVMQTRWEAWREARCAVEAVMRRGTPFKSTAAASCTMKLTGQQALFLESAVKYKR